MKKLKTKSLWLKATEGFELVCWSSTGSLQTDGPLSSRWPMTLESARGGVRDKRHCLCRKSRSTAVTTVRERRGYKLLMPRQIKSMSNMKSEIQQWAAREVRYKARVWRQSGCQDRLTSWRDVCQRNATAAGITASWGVNNAVFALPRRTVRELIGGYGG